MSKRALRCFCLLTATGVIPIRPPSPPAGGCLPVVNPFASRTEDSHKTSVYERILRIYSLWQSCLSALNRYPIVRDVTPRCVAASA
jgi:hypothetical protein